MEEKDRAEAALRRQTEELARSNKELEQFASVASHDLQEPLRKIITFGDRLMSHSGSKLDDLSQDYLKRMQHAASRMRQLVDALLQYATVTSKAEPLQDVNLNHLVQEVLLDLELALVKANAKVDVGPLPTLKAEPVQMRQLFQNLIANALKFSKKDKKPHIKIHSRELGDGCAEISVNDNGVGFDEKYLDRIFMPFQRLHGYDTFEGIGIGLTICHRIVQRHGGQISAKSTLGKGSTFIITIPLSVLKKEESFE